MSKPGLSLVMAGLTLAGMAASVTASAGAQPDTTRWDSMRLRAGAPVYVLDTLRRETLGAVVALDTAGLTIRVGAREDRFARSAVLRISKSGDWLGNGALTGALIGAAAAAFGGCGIRECRKGEPALLILGGAALYGGLGILIDKRIEGRTTLYSGPRR